MAGEEDVDAEVGCAEEPVIGVFSEEGSILDHLDVDEEYDVDIAGCKEPVV